MKKSLTVFAAAAMLATFAGVVMAATPTISMTGSYTWSAEYNGLSKSWVAPTAAYGSNAISFSVTAGGNPTLTVTNAYPGFDLDATLTGILAGANVALGAVDAGFAGTALSGVGAKASKAFGNVTLTGVSVGSNVGAGATLDLGNGNSAFGTVALNPEFEGLAVLGSNYTLGSLGLSGKVLTSVGEDKNTKLFYVAANSNLVEGFSLSANVAKADAGYDPKFNGAADPWGEDWTNPYVIAKYPHFAGKDLNFKLSGTLTVIKDVATVGATYAKYADNFNYIQVSGSNSDICLTNASAKFKSDKTNDYSVTFAKTVAGVGLSATGNLYTTETGNSTSAVLKATKSFEWLSTWASVEKTTTDQFVPKVGASASISW